MFYSDAEEKEIAREIIMDHYKHPRNKGLISDKDYFTVHFKNPSCGDDINVQVKIKDDKLEDVRQDGKGCSICCSSASMMSELLKGNDLKKAQYIIKQFKQMVSAEEYDEDCLGEAVTLKGVAKLQPRIKCATLSWLACEEGLKGKQNE